MIQTALLVPEQKSTRKQLSDVAAASGTPHASRPVLFQQPQYCPRHRTGNAKQPHTAHADTLCTTTCRPFPARRCRCALALTPPPAQVHRAEKPMAPSPLLVRPLALANSPLPPPRCVAAVAAAPAVRTAPAAPFSRLVITWRMRSSFSAKFRGDMVSLDRAGSVPSVGSPHRM